MRKLLVFTYSNLKILLREDSFLDDTDYQIEFGILIYFKDEILAIFIFDIHNIHTEIL